MILDWPATVTNLTRVAALAAKAGKAYEHLRVTAVLEGGQVRMHVDMTPPDDPAAQRQLEEFLSSLPG